jgi:hypothetical protein
MIKNRQRHLSDIFSSPWGPLPATAHLTRCSHGLLTVFFCFHFAIGGIRGRHGNRVWVKHEGSGTNSSSGVGGGKSRPRATPISQMQRRQPAEPKHSIAFPERIPSQLTTHLAKLKGKITLNTYLLMISERVTDNRRKNSNKRARGKQSTVGTGESPDNNTHHTHGAGTAKRRATAANNPTRAMAFSRLQAAAFTSQLNLLRRFSLRLFQLSSTPSM